MGTGWPWEMMGVDGGKRISGRSGGDTAVAGMEPSPTVVSAGLAVVVVCRVALSRPNFLRNFDRATVEMR